MKTVTESREHIELVPEHLRYGLLLYIEEHIEPGHFLMAVLENNLMEAMGRADENSRAGLFNLCTFLYNYAPSTCHGSPEKVAKWLDVSSGAGHPVASEPPEPALDYTAHIEPFTKAVIVRRNSDGKTLALPLNELLAEYPGLAGDDEDRVLCEAAIEDAKQQPDYVWG